MGIYDLFAKLTTDEGVEEFHRTSGAVLLDVRTPEEYAGGYIGSSRNLPLSEIQTAPDIIPDKNTPIFVYCHSGARSRQALVLLKQMGYRNIKDIGGIAGYHGKVEK